MKMALKLHGQVVQVIHSHSRGMNASGEDVFAVLGDFDAMARRRKPKVLNEVNVACIVCVLAELLPSLLRHPRGNDFVWQSYG